MAFVVNLLFVYGLIQGWFVGKVVLVPLALFAILMNWNFFDKTLRDRGIVIVARKSIRVLIIAVNFTLLAAMLLILFAM